MWLKSANNAKALILGTLLASGGFVTVKDSKGWLFPVVYPYRCTLTKFVNWIVTQREIVEVTSRTGDIFTISRGVEGCPANDTTSITQTTTAFTFSDNDSFQLTRPASKDTEVDTELARLETDKLNKSWWILIWLIQWAKSANIASATTTNLATATGNFAHITWTTTITGFGTVTAWTQITLIFDWILTLTRNAVSLILPTGANITTKAGDSAIFESEWSGNWKCVSYLRADWIALNASININALTEKTSLVDNDEFLIYDSVWEVNKKITKRELYIIDWFWNWIDWNVTISSWTTTIIEDMYYNNLTITSPWILNTNGYRIYVKWILSWTGTIINNGWAWWNASAEVAWAWWILTVWTLSEFNASWNWWTWTTDVTSPWGWYWTWWNASFSNLNWVAWWNGWSWNHWIVWWSWWGWWTSVRWKLYNSFLGWILDVIKYKCSWWAWWGWAWSRGVNWTAAWWGGWWGWAHWGLVFLCAFTINFTWNINAIGWNWWNWWVWGWWIWGWWWWGWGWNWWIIFIQWRTISAIWTTNTSAWTAWTFWTWYNNWTAWTAWNAWATIQITI